MITLINFGPAFGLPDPSPFCMKAELLLKMADLPYGVEIAGDPRRGPKRKLPAIVDDGETIGNSEIIRWHLERKYKIEFDRGLSPGERAVAHAFARMLEERTYWVGVYNRWIENRELTDATFFSKLPPVLRTLVPIFAQRSVRRYLHGQGLGRHSRDEIHAMGIADLRAVAEQLGDKPYFMAGEPTGVDATVYAIVAGVLVPPFVSPLKDEAKRHANLVAYEQRMRERFYGARPAA